MRSHRRLIRLLVIWGLTLPVCTWCVLLFARAEGAGDPTARSIVPGDAILQFKSGTDGDHGLRRATGQNVDLATALGPTIAGLGEHAGIPLFGKQPLSDHRVLVGIDCRKLLQQTASRLRAESAYESVEYSVLSSQSCPIAGAALTLILESKSPDEVRASELKPDLSSPDLLEALDRALDLPHHARMEGRTIVVELDVLELTHLVIRRLGTFPELASVQPNYRMRFR